MSLSSVLAPPPSASAASATPALARGVAVQPSAYVTTSGLGQALQSTAMAPFAPLAGPVPVAVTVDPTETYQAFDGVGAAITDSSAWNLLNNMSPSQRHALLVECFGTGGFSTVRVCMGSSDFSSVPFATYDDAANDVSLTKFSVAMDAARVIPVLQEILAINPRLKVIASPWSPPAWMKANGSLLGGAFVVSAQNMTTWAQYFVDFIQAYAGYGIPIWAVTTANEPGYAPSYYPGCTWAPADMATFIGSYLGPALDAAGLTTKVVVGDHNWDVTPAFVAASLASTSAAPYLEGIGFHGYGGAPAAQRACIRPYLPGKKVHFTEHCVYGTSDPAAIQTQYARDIVIGTFRNFASSVTLWNLVLRPDSGPTYNNQGCRPVIFVANDGSGALTRLPEYYAIAHIGRFVRPGAKRCASTTGTVQSVAFVNADGSVAVFLWNSSSSAQTVTVIDAVIELGSTLALPANAMATVAYGGTGPVPAGTLAAPGAPSLAAASTVAGAVALTVAPPAAAGDTGIGAYAIFRGTAAGTESPNPVAVLPPGTLGFTDTSVTSGTAYVYTAKALGGGGASAASAEASVTPRITLQALTLSSTVATAGVAFMGVISGQSPGSTVTASSSDGTALAVANGAVTGTFAAAGSPNVTLTETLAGAVGSPRASTTAITVSAAAAAGSFVPTALASTKRWITAGDTTAVTTATGSAGAYITSLPDKTGSGKPFTNNGDTVGFGLASSSSFGSSKVAFRSTDNGSVGPYGYLQGDFSDLAGTSVFAVLATVAPTSGQTYGRILSLAPANDDDYDAPGRLDLNFGANGSGPLKSDHNSLTPGSYAYTSGTPILAELYCDGSTLTYAVNGAVIGTCAWSGSWESAVRMRIGRDQSGQELGYMDLRALVVSVGDTAVANRQKLEGYLAWDATGDGSLLPSGHPYKSAAP